VRRAPAIAAALGVALLTRAEGSRACASAPPDGKWVRIAAEEALVAWDAGKETFVRRAHFRTDAKDFGFLVPTPSQPRLSEVDDALFDALDEHTKPELVDTPRYELGCAALMFLGRGVESAAVPLAAAPVTVLDVARVAGMDATVLSATDAGALARWLDDHGYARRPALEQWLEPYVASGWTITAFKYVAGEGSQDVGSKAVRMDFASAEPFYPYREPDEGVEPVRSLRVWTATPWRAEGRVGGSAPWGADLEYAGELDAQAFAPWIALGPNLRLGAFRDASTKRAPGELSFVKAKDQSDFRKKIPAPRTVTLPVDLAVVVLLVVVAPLALLVARRRSA
jgi:hypothetical protein